MKFRSEWLTVLILTVLGFGALAFPRHETPPALAQARVPQDGIDYTPIGSSHRAHPPKPHQLHRN